MAYKDISDPRNKEAKRKHYSENKEQYNERNRKSREELRQIVLDFKSQPCLDCGESYEDEPWLMELDHRDPTEKESEISKLIANSSKRKLLVELEKCDPLCIICHRRRTAKMFGWRKNRFIKG